MKELLGLNRMMQPNIFEECQSNREIFDITGDIDDLLPVQYKRERRIPVAVDALIIRLLLDENLGWSNNDPSVKHRTKWIHPVTGVTLDINRRWTNVPRNSLSCILLKEHKCEFQTIMREMNCQPLGSKKGLIDNLPSTRFVKEVLKSLSWLSTGK